MLAPDPAKPWTRGRSALRGAGQVEKGEESPERKAKTVDRRLRECEVVYRTTSPQRLFKVTSSESVYRLFSAEMQRAHESLWVILLDARMQVLATHEVARGGLTSVSVEPASIFRAAIVVGAAAVVLVHNHPSGDPKPSREDMEFTERLIEAGKLLGVSILDHVVIAESGYRSLLDAGLLRSSR
jgi:DNA repair protein RadC